MATWKKVIVSGSTANLAALQVDNLTSGQVVIGGGQAGNLSTTAINGTGNIVATTGASGLVHSGSFSGSFFGQATASLQGTASYALQALSASYATTASYALNASSFPFSGSAVITGSLLISGSAVAALAVTGAVSATSFTGSFSGSHFGPLTGTASYATQALTASNANTASYLYPGTYAVTSSWATSASYALVAGQTQFALTLGNGLSGTSFNGSSAVTAAVGAGALISVGTGLTAVATSSLAANQIPKYSNNTLSGSNISDTGTQVQIAAAASSGLSVAAGGVNVTGNSTFNNNVTITGDLSVAGTASFTNTDNLNVRDKFILINSGSSTLADSGWISQYNTAGSGSAFFLEAASTGNYGRFAVAYDAIGTATSIAADEFVVTAKINQGAGPGAAVSSSWGGANSTGNMWVTTGGDIYIYS